VRFTRVCQGFKVTGIIFFCVCLIGCSKPKQAEAGKEPNRKVSDVQEQEAPVAEPETVKEPDAVERLINDLMDRDASVRVKAVEALWKLKDPRAVEPLRAALLDEDKFVRLFAVRALGQLKDPRAIKPLLAVAENDEDLGVRSAAARAIKQIQRKR